MMSQTSPNLSNGRLVSGKVIDRINPRIEKGAMMCVNGIVVHQTDGGTADSSLSNYAKGGKGAHFLIDKDGTIYQTARVTQKCWHVGRIKSRCDQLKSCSPAELKNIQAIMHKQGSTYSARLRTLHHHEMTKPYPDRYPSNEDSLGIELVARCFPKTGYESATAAQNSALRWLVTTLERLLFLSAPDVYRHPEVSTKQPTEAASARW